MKTFYNQLQNRLIDFSCEMIEVSESLPKSYTGKYLSEQLLRSGISPSLNYAEACSAESRADFIHKMKVALKELRETEVCLAIIKKSKKFSIELETSMKEADELISIFVKSIQTARLKLEQQKSEKTAKH